MRVIDQARQLAAQWEELMEEVDKIEHQLGDLFRIRPASLDEAEKELAEIEATVPEEDRLSSWARTAMGKWSYHRHLKLADDFIPQLGRMQEYETRRKRESREERERHAQQLEQFKREVLGLKPGDPGWD